MWTRGYQPVLLCPWQPVLASCPWQPVPASCWICAPCGCHGACLLLRSSPLLAMPVRTCATCHKTSTAGRRMSTRARQHASTPNRKFVHTHTHTHREGMRIHEQTHTHINGEQNKKTHARRGRQLCAKLSVPTPLCPCTLRVAAGTHLARS